ncbi:MAG: bifunctional riboflavin kinase/FAD synthetase [Pseudomonadota bacterium]
MLLIDGSSNFPNDVPRPVVALGNFDGVHVGHRRVIERAMEEANISRGTSVVYTFDPHPVRILAPAECPPLIQTKEQKLSAIEALGANICVVEPFTARFASMDAAEFLNEVVVARLHAAAIVAGYDFTFGLHRLGDMETITEFCREKGIGAFAVEARFSGETLISSTNIRRLVEGGNIREAAALLGRPYRITGRVVAGRALGRELGARTANIESQNELIPKEGVYLTQTIIPSGASEPAVHPSITSIGDNPTFRDAAFTIETHIIGADVDLMGIEIEVDFIDRMRDQKAFDSAQALGLQIRLDIELARKMRAKVK